jgi:GNAT superfamily N-acetyltransferase
MVTTRQVELLSEALALAPALDRGLAERAREFQDEPLATGLARTFLGTHFDAPETVLVAAESEAGAADLGLCLTAPFTDLVLGTRMPLIRVLSVSPAHRHRGIARALVDEVKRVLERRGIARLAAQVGHNDDALISMGERWGFVRHWELLLRD